MLYTHIENFNISYFRLFFFFCSRIFEEITRTQDGLEGDADMNDWKADKNYSELSKRKRKMATHPLTCA